MNRTYFSNLPRIVAFALALGVFGIGGCSTCCSPYDNDYPVFGGRFQRSDPANGRVGSMFTDPNFSKGQSADSNLKPHGSDQRHRAGDEEFLGPTAELFEGETLPTPPAEPIPDTNSTANAADQTFSENAWRSRSDTRRLDLR